MWARVIVGAVLLVVGLVWIGQGVGAIGGSFMTGQAVWAVFGGIAVVFGLALIRGARHDRDDHRA
jgi:hypothetical protein